MTNLRVGVFNVERCREVIGGAEIESKFFKFCQRSLDILAVQRVTNNTLPGILDILIRTGYSIHPSKTAGRIVFELLCVKGPPIPNKHARGASFTANRKSSLYSNTHSSNCLTWAEIKSADKTITVGLTEFEDPTLFPKMSWSQLQCAMTFLKPATVTATVLFGTEVRTDESVGYPQGWSKTLVPADCGVQMWLAGSVKNVGMGDMDGLGYAIEGLLSCGDDLMYKGG